MSLGYIRSMIMSEYGPNRYVCSVIEEMRYVTKHLSHFNMFKYKKVVGLLIEEMQMHVNIMEANLQDVSDIQKLLEERRALKKEVKQLKLKKARLTETSDDN
jgi:hypothetical protein